jgi:hypothetical protein
MLANAITDAKTNFFIQCSWELPKWRSMFNHSLTDCTTVFWAIERRGDEYYDTTASNAVLEGL